MANEITITGSLTGSKGSAGISSGSVSKSFDMAGDDFQTITQTIATTETTLTPSTGIGTEGAFMIRNLDTANFIELGFSTGVYPLKVPPGAPLVGVLNTGDIVAKADTAACLVQWWLCEA